MQLDFRQGIIRRQENIAAQPAHLVKGSPDDSYIDLVVAPVPTIITFAHRDQNYTYKEEFSVSQAWGPFAPLGQTQYLLWDLNLATGRVTRTYTLYPIHVAATAPGYDQVDKHWFDTSENVMKVQQADLSWKPVARVLAGIYDNTATLVHVSLGTQVGISGQLHNSGFILFDDSGRAIRKVDGKFVTSEDALLTENQSTSSYGFTIEDQFAKRVKANTILPAFSAVTLSDSDTVVLADNTSSTRTVSGVIIEQLNPGNSTLLITKGRVVNPGFLFSVNDLGKYVYTDNTGTITLTPPTAGVSQVIGTVYDRDSIYVDIQPPVILQTSGVGILKPLYLDPVTGKIGEMPNNSATNIGAVWANNFAVGGLGVVLADGTISTGGQATVINLQTAYNNTSVSGIAQISLANGKHFRLNNASSGAYLVFNSDTGKLTVSGDMEVLGTTTVINSTITDSDYITLTPSVGTQTALRIEPESGVTQTADIVVVKNIYNGLPNFKIDYMGRTTVDFLTVAQNIVVAGTVDGVDVSAFKTLYDNHIAVSSNKHLAQEINVYPTLTNLGASFTNVQDVLEEFDTLVKTHTDDIALHETRLDDIEAALSPLNGINAIGLTHTQAVASTTWTINHAKNSRNVVIQFYDSTYKRVEPADIDLSDLNTITVTWAVAQAGTANMIFYAV